MKKILTGIFAVIGIIAVVGAIVGIFVIHALIDGKQPNTGVIQKDGGEVLFISSRSGQGGTFYRFLKNDGVMSSDIQDGTGVGSAEFVPLKSGRCVIAAENYFAGDFDSERVYDVTVDENLKISFVHKYINQFALYDDISFENCLMTVQNAESSAVLPKETAAEIGNELNVIYGTETVGRIAAPDISQCVKIICEQSDEKYYANTVEFYICGNKLYYCNFIAGDEQWHEFIPDGFCSLDGINELLDIKE